jgi:hypothetical protein
MTAPDVIMHGRRQGVAVAGARTMRNDLLEGAR